MAKVKFSTRVFLAPKTTSLTGFNLVALLKLSNWFISMDLWHVLSQAMRGPNGDEPVVGTRFKRIFITDASNTILLQINETSSYIIPVMNQIPLRFCSKAFHFHFICLQGRSYGCSTMTIFWIRRKMIMRANHAPMSLRSISLERWWFHKADSSIPRIEHMHLSWMKCSPFLFYRHELQRDFSVLDIEDPWVFW